MSCSNCGSGGCGGCSGSRSSIAPFVSGCRCGVSPCSCGQPATPTPFYETSPQCQENHCKEVITKHFSSAICSSFAANMPACAATVTIYFQDVRVLPVGTFLWNEAVGYLEVTAFNFRTGAVTLLNNCNEGNVPAGTNIPACTCFTVSPPPCCSDEDPNTPFVAEDFTAPADGDCTTISVTSIAGLVVGGEVAIGTGIYTLDSIVGPNTIVICNTGEGITPGTVVEARNEAGQLQYPITAIATNPCTATAAASGPVVICSGGALTTLSGSANGDILVLSNSGDETAGYVTAGLVGGNDITEAENMAIASPDTEFTADIVELNVTNTHPSKTMQLHVTASFISTLASNNPGAGATFGVQQQINGAGYVEFKRNSGIAMLDGSNQFPVQVVGHYVYAIPAGSSILLQYRGFVTALLQDMESFNTILQLSYIGVAV